MPDTIGFALATAFLASAFTIFGVIDRFVAGVASEIRYSVAPAMVSGVRAWGEQRRPAHQPSPPAEETPGGTAGTGGETTPDRHDQGLVVPVTPVPRRGWRLFGRVMAGLLAVRRRPAGLSQRA
ncbi:MAG: hypothetical protein A2V85_16655 [Chloroflexi bacterium RBG_16_72_14]|nr:MAG: hypothetical protein A2V85_16655 [Chloroflexi bacterium RBG_16_72_14]